MTRRLNAGSRFAVPAPVSLIALLAVLLRVGLAWTTHFTQEDFLITLRYAENMARGQGFVYNPGEHVLGTTTPLYTLLLAGVTALGLPAAAWGKALNILADGAQCLVVYRWFARIGQYAAGYAVAFLIAVNPVQMRVAISGQESSLVALCGALIWLWYAERQYLAAYAMAAFLFLLRWDSLLLTGVLTMAITWQERQPPWRGLALALLICLPWLLFATAYFGSAIPVTLAAKTTVYGWYFHDQRFPELSRLLFRLWGTPLYAAMAIGAWIGVWRMCRERWTFFLPPLVWFLLYWTAFVVSKVWLFEWYLVPPLSVYEACAALGWVTVFSWLARRLPRPACAAAILAGAAWLCVFNVRETFVFTQASQNLEDQLRCPLGLWLRAHSRPADHVMLEPIGYIGYYSRLPIVDVTGLVTPGVLPCYGPGHASPFRAIVEKFRPEWCVLRPQEVVMMSHGSSSFAERSWAAEYALVATFTYAPPAPSLPAVFYVYRRRTSARPQETPPSRQAVPPPRSGEVQREKHWPQPLDLSRRGDGEPKRAGGVSLLRPKAVPGQETRRAVRNGNASALG